MGDGGGGVGSADARFWFWLVAAGPSGDVGGGLPGDSGRPVDVAAGGVTLYAGGLIEFALYVRRVLAGPRRRRIPTAALHLVAALAWAAVTSLSLVASFARSDLFSARDVLVVGGAGGFVFQALIGAWSFLLPSTRPPVPQRRRRELTSMELLGRPQVIAYNAGLLAIIAGSRMGSGVSLAGIVITWCAAAWVVGKLWLFPVLGTLPYVQARSDHWWASP